MVLECTKLMTTLATLEDIPTDTEVQIYMVKNLYYEIIQRNAL